MENLSIISASVDSNSDIRATGSTTHNNTMSIAPAPPPPPPPPRKFKEGGVGTEQQPRSLLSLCLGCLGSHLEEVIDDMDAIALFLPPSVKLKILAIAHRRRMLTNELLLALVDESWELLDVSGSVVTDETMMKVARLCPLLKVVDISHCSHLTSKSIEVLVEKCSHLQTLRCGGNSASDAAARNGLPFILPSLNQEATAESWEELDTKQVVKGAQVLRWLVWPSIDKRSRELLEVEGPRIVVNPKRLHYGYFQKSIPMEALPDAIVDEQILVDIDPQTWAVVSSIEGAADEKHTYSGLSIAERFKLAFMERDERLAPKRAKNLRQNQRRAEKVWLRSDNAKALLWAGMMRKR